MLRVGANSRKGSGRKRQVQPLRVMGGQGAAAFTWGRQRGIEGAVSRSRRRGEAGRAGRDKASSGAGGACGLGHSVPRMGYEGRRSRAERGRCWGTQLSALAVRRAHCPGSGRGAVRGGPPAGGTSRSPHSAGQRRRVRAHSESSETLGRPGGHRSRGWCGRSSRVVGVSGGPCVSRGSCSLWRDEPRLRGVGDATGRGGARGCGSMRVGPVTEGFHSGRE